MISFSCWFLYSLGEENCKSNHNDQRKTKSPISGKIPQTEESESKVFVGLLIAIVELYDSAITDKPELVTILTIEKLSLRNLFCHVSIKKKPPFLIDY